jgi:hypothetical protein
MQADAWEKPRRPSAPFFCENKIGVLAHIYYLKSPSRRPSKKPENIRAAATNPDQDQPENRAVFPAGRGKKRRPGFIIFSSRLDGGKARAGQHSQALHAGA